MGFEIKTKKWGNSIGIIIPSRIIEKLNIRLEENLVVEINKKGNVLKEMFGALKFKASTRKLIKEARTDLESKWLK